jgi:NADPH:quinone reductase-like Zn-dependent oxidoreductase
VCGPDDILVAIHAASLNPLDSKIRDGEFKLILPYKPPFVLGHDLAGVVVGLGERVRQFKIGDEVFARPRDGRIGAFANLIAFPAEDAALKPRTLSMAEAAALPLTALTAWQVLIERAALQPDQKILIHAGAGGVGVVAIQLAKHLGATVATTASGAGADLVRKLGADIVIDYRSQRFENELSNYDVVLNSLDSKTLKRSLAVLKRGGKLLSISGPPDPEFARKRGMNWIMRQIITLLSSSIRREARLRGVDYGFVLMAANGAQLAQIADLADQGKIRPVIDRVFAFDALNDALAYVDTGRAKGKVVVAMKATA